MIAWHFLVTFLLDFCPTFPLYFPMVIALPFLAPFGPADMRFYDLGNGIHDKTV